LYAPDAELAGAARHVICYQKDVFESAVDWVVAKNTSSGGSS
jgi:hypothetical protein